MKIIKRAIAFAAFVLILIVPLVSCQREAGAQDDGKISIIATIFPQYDWIRQIISGNEENINLTLLADNGADLHNYQPSTEDIVKISDCDVLVYVGGESDAWIDDLLESSDSKMTVINMLDVIGNSAKAEEIKEGMETLHSHDENASDGSEKKRLDEHVWLSLKNARILCSRIAEELAVKDPDFADGYKENADRYNAELERLDEQYKEVTENSDCKTLLFADRFPFRYLTEDYGIEYYAAFPGCSAETEASFETIAFLSDKVAEMDLKYIMTVDGSDSSVAETVIENSKLKNREILSLNSMQTVTADDISNGETYLSAMQSNLDILKKALGEK